MNIVRSVAVLLSLMLVACSDDTGGDADAPVTPGDGPVADGLPADGPLTDGPLTDGPLTDGPGTDASGPSTGPLKCTSYTTPSFSKACSVAADCVVAMHTTDCCGTARAHGISKSEKTTFTVEEKKCADTYPACGCPPGPTKTDDGSSGGFVGKIGVECVTGVCTTYIEGCGAPCAGALTCRFCTASGADYYVCSKDCTSDTDCTDPKLPKCEDPGYGAKFCTANVGCGT